jgi:hypothetical protein
VTARLAGCPSLLRSFGAALRKRSRLPANVNTTMEKLTFPQRVRSMQAAVEHLRALLVIVEQEAEAMAEVQKRFAAKKTAKDPITR